MDNSETEKQRQEIARAYMVAFGSPEGQVVLDDLRTLYSGSSITTDFNPNRTMVLEGCRLVLLKIVEMLETGKMYASGSDTRTVTTNDSDTQYDGESDQERVRPIYRFES